MPAKIAKKPKLPEKCPMCEAALKNDDHCLKCTKCDWGLCTA